MEDFLPETFIAIGVANIIIIYYLRYQFNKTTQSLSKIITLNKNLHYDIEKLLPQAEQILQELGINDYGYKIYFFDDLIHSKKTKNIYSTFMINDSVTVGDYRINLTLHPKHYIGENKNKYDLIMKTLILIIQEDLLIKSEAVNKSFENLSKFHTFLLHDTKNIAQFFHTLKFNIDNCETQNDKNRLFDYLKSSTTTLDKKISKILKIIEQTSNENIYSEKTSINIKKLIQEIVYIYKLPCTIEGEAVIKANHTILYMVFENLIKNLNEKKQKEKDIKIYINIHNTEESLYISFEDTGSKIKEPNRIFEPFYTTKSEGLGIGLYKVKTLLSNINATIKITNEPNVKFEITI